MNTPATTASDSTYHARHSARSLRRARRIADNIDRESTVLDVGCNNGITSQFLLDCGKASHVTGVELHAETVDNSLRQDARFELIEGNIAELELEDDYDVCVYGAVHHHILNFYGLSAAIRTLQMLASHTNRTLFFETGQISEGGRWDWQRAMRQYFRTDEEHFFYLLRSIEHLVEDFSVIGKFWIHAARRSYLRIDLKARAERSGNGVAAPMVAMPADADGPLQRSFGSGNQALSPAQDDSDSPTLFWSGVIDDGQRVFIKQYRHHPIAAQPEYSIGRSCAAPWPVKAIATTHKPASLVFPYIDDAMRIPDFRKAPAEVRQQLATQLLSVAMDARRNTAALDGGALLRARPNARLWDLCDMNVNNVLVQGSNDEPQLRVVDFEQQGIHYGYRNRLHLSKMLRSLRQRRLRAAAEWLSGVGLGLWHALRYQLRPLEIRIRDRQPGVFSILVADVRTAGGRLLKRVLAMVGLG